MASVAKITTKVLKRMTSRPGKPLGRASATARLTTPRMPAQPGTAASSKHHARTGMPGRAARGDGSQIARLTHTRRAMTAAAAAANATPTPAVKSAFCA